MVMANYFVNGDGISTPLDIYIYIYIPCIYNRDIYMHPSHIPKPVPYQKPLKIVCLALFIHNRIKTQLASYVHTYIHTYQPGTY